jgi:hypothetical protein
MLQCLVIHAHKKYVDEQLLKIEARQKEIIAKSDISLSPIHASMDFPPPSTFYNPWEEMGGPSMMFGAPQVDDNDIEEDLGGREKSDDKEEEEVPAANTPTDEEEEVMMKVMRTTTMSDGYGMGSPF